MDIEAEQLGYPTFEMVSSQFTVTPSRDISGASTIRAGRESVGSHNFTVFERKFSGRRDRRPHLGYTAFEPGFQHQGVRAALSSGCRPTARE